MRGKNQQINLCKFYLLAKAAYNLTTIFGAIVMLLAFSATFGTTVLDIFHSVELIFMLVETVLFIALFVLLLKKSIHALTLTHIALGFSILSQIHSLVFYSGPLYQAFTSQSSTFFYLLTIVIVPLILSAVVWVVLVRQLTNSM